MPQKNPIEPLLSQIGDLINKIRDCDKPIGEITPEIRQKIDMLQAALRLYTEFTTQVYQQSGIDIDKVRCDTLVDPNLDRKDKQVYERLRLLENDARALQQEVAKILKDREAKPEPTTDTTKKEKRARKGKFKPIGGDRGWIHL